MESCRSSKWNLSVCLHARFAAVVEASYFRRKSFSMLHLRALNARLQLAIITRIKSCRALAIVRRKECARGGKAARFLPRSVHHAKILIGKISREGVQSRQKVWLTAFPSRKVMKSIHCWIELCVVCILLALCYFFYLSFFLLFLFFLFYSILFLFSSLNERSAFSFALYYLINLFD